MTGIEDVPFDVLREIFDLIDDYDTFRRLWKVCKRWQRVFCHPLTLRRAYSTKIPMGRFINWRVGELGVGVIEGQALPDGTRHGKQQAQRTDGGVKWKSTFSHGKQHGKEFYYGQFGTLTQYVEWKHGRTEGIQVTYVDVTGFLEKVALWENGAITCQATRDRWYFRYVEKPEGCLERLVGELKKRDLPCTLFLSK